MRYKMIVLTFLAAILLLQTVQAHEEISLVDVSHTLKKERQAGGWTIRTYIINVTLANNGDTASVDTTVDVEDNEGFILHKNTTLNPGETKVLSFEWTTKNPQQQIVNISYGPTSKNVPHTSYNSGKTTLTIEALPGYENNGKKTPGFEFMFLVAALLMLVYKRKHTAL
ncbi:MAG: hypothetical protein DRN01_05750 [Thermoplasmata archaeon]|nr:MAG: hypothetical protein FE035_01115 [Thermoplasmata archaeon]RLF25986.1 MAG: hypothetical protein DRN01_05750 [Thermoplasmata archaeon]